MVVIVLENRQIKCVWSASYQLSEAVETSVIGEMLRRIGVNDSPGQGTGIST